MESGGNIEEGFERILLGDMVFSFEEIGILDEIVVFCYLRQNSCMLIWCMEKFNQMIMGELLLVKNYNWEFRWCMGGMSVGVQEVVSYVFQKFYQWLNFFVFEL